MPVLSIEVQALLNDRVIIKYRCKNVPGKVVRMEIVFAAQWENDPFVLYTVEIMHQKLKKTRLVQVRSIESTF